LSLQFAVGVFGAVVDELQCKAVAEIRGGAIQDFQEGLRQRHCLNVAAAALPVGEEVIVCRRFAQVAAFIYRLRLDRL
jgi:hypothetical protein